MLSASGVQRVTGANQSQTVAEIDRSIATQLGSLVALDSLDGRELWVAGHEAVGRFDGTWTITPLAELGDASPAASIDLAIDAAGIPWLQHGPVHRYEQGKWQLLELPTAPLALWPATSSGAMFLHLGCGGEPSTCTLARYADGVAKPAVAPAGDCRELPALALSSDGSRAVLGGRCGLLRLRLDTPELTTELLPARAGGWTGQPLRSLAIDDSGRVWVGTNDGLTLVDAGAEASVQEIAIGELVEMSGAITNLIVSGQGPSAPARGQVRTGGLQATIVTEVAGVKQPRVGATVELCSRLPLGGELPPDPTRSPCAGVEPTHVAVTDTNGTFVVESLPISNYYVGVEIDGRWARGVPKALHMRAGMTGNVGKIVVTVSE
ncbi:hypothetical protein ENSA7_50590 [Enhygromyxa salina]|uniref:Uncharacterized protein n=2 Tax=Enhygromyxa salina TaxID=215803 RepID=A0A2S9YHI3_9BACT|nr:hypothetical protein ENSA7_50590 [Enhygromyxa salina]